jgi:hypothetical protein
VSWSREELESAFASYAEAVERSWRSGDWEPFVQCFTPDASYVEHAYGRFSGHDAIRRWVTRTMTSFPGSEMVGFPAAWTTYDVERGWVICEIRNLMRDPGDGTVLEASNLTILRYAGDGLWAEEEDVYNPATFLDLATRYVRHCARLGTLSDDGRAFADKLRIDLAG